MKKFLCMILALAAALSLPAVPASAARTAPSALSGNAAEHWFYDQLSDGGKDIYNALWDMYDRGMMKDGKTSYDLADEGVVSQAAIAAYLNGDRALFNDFAAAKDAFDLEHPEVWYMDSSYLSFRVVQDAAGLYHAYMGPGRSDDYYVSGVKGAADVDRKTAELEAVIGSIVSGAKAVSGSSKQVQYVHKRITEGISYRFETECRPENAGYLRTVYALVTHEGVCEAYARSMQLALNRLGIPCVPVHGLQTSGTPEAHMWNAVRIEGNWYVVDATWDDPVGLDAGGNIKSSGRTGLDGGETETYLLVGQDVVGANWRPSGYVSTGAMEFSYPGIALVSFGGGMIEKNGLTVTYADDLMEGADSTVYHISYNGKGLVESAKNGIYFLVKMYDVNADGSVDMFDDWYYSVHGLHAVQDHFDPNNDFKNGGNPYFADTDEYLIYNVINCEYVEFAVTTKAPPDWRSAMDLFNLGGYYSGDGSDILAETGLIFNANGSYEQPPYVKNVSPLFNSPVYVGPTYTIHIEFTDALYHPDQASVDNAVAGKVNDAEKAMAEAVTLDYTGTTYNWGVNARRPHTFADKPTPQNVRWVCETHGAHSGMGGIGADCRLTTLEFEFSGSRMWADDSVEYQFRLTGLVGVKSNKYVMDCGGWSYVFENQSAYCSYRCSQGIDWNLWGQPQLLDNPDDLDLGRMVVEGVDGKQKTLEQLRGQMHLDDYDMNGRLMLVVENIAPESSRAGELSEAISKSSNVNVPAGAVMSSALYEIDFARICRSTVVETGQSLRLSVGFPEGFDAGMEGIVFKAYHFTRNDAGEIVSVEELPITVTRYGLILMCDSFSPFEIVALDAGLINEKPNAEKTVMILAGEGGDVLLPNGTAAAGAGGVVTLSAGQSVTLRLRPGDGKALDAVTLDGSVLPVSDDGSVVVAYEDIGSAACLLSASFISSAVRQADETAGMTPVTSGAGAPRGDQNSGSPIPPSGTAHASTEKVEIDGKTVEFKMYALWDDDGYPTNYIRVRDLALALNGTRAQFSVDWDGFVRLTAGRPYASDGPDQSTPFEGEDRPYVIPAEPTYVNGADSGLIAIYLEDDDGGGYTYYQLRDLGRKLGFNVDWTADRGVFVETGKPYTGI